MRSRCAAALAVIALMATACGDDDGDAGTSTTTTTAATSTTPQTGPAADELGFPLTFVAPGGDGVTTTIESRDRIIPLSGDIAEIVFALGLGDQVVAVDVSATFPAEVVGPLPKVGFERTLSAEAIIAMEPTVVIGDLDAGPPEVIEQVRSADIPVVILPTDLTLNGALDKIHFVAAALGVPLEGAALAASVKAEIDAAVALAATAGDGPRVAFVYARGPEVLLFFGRGSEANALLTAAGAVDTGAEAGINGFAPLTPEGLIAANPDVLVIPEMGLGSIGGIPGLLEIPGVAQTPAAQQGRILTYDDLYILGLTPRVGQALQELVGDLYPDLSSSS